ncbi:hypothetical protein FB45DRAFT_1084754 [Roridomyces roridus]|uniref:F-box domain-containing protein n=1 Tax=Roridomyces roridus TaxID=1738132 RepID=A0AAD7BNB5_9AGAR|nr:hypothetical protein FB45DRAFT_1084754 [Roridomyces roridus]
MLPWLLELSDLPTAWWELPNKNVFPDADIETRCFELAPRLTRMKLKLDTNFMTNFPCHQITDLTIASSTALQFATKCPNLIYLVMTEPRLEGSFWRPLESPSRTVVTARQLCTSPYLLEYLTAPNLAALRVVGDAESKLEWFTSFIFRSAPSLHTLDLQKVAFQSSADLLALLALLPTLHSLLVDLDRPHLITNMVLTRLTITPLSAIPLILPSLTSLTITGSYLFSNAALLIMLESRLDPPLQRVELWLTQRTFSDAELERVRALKGKAEWFALRCLDANKKFMRMV